MPVATIDTSAAQIDGDDDLTDLSWLLQLNNPHRHPHAKSPLPTFNEPQHEIKSKKLERAQKPLAVVNGQTMRSSMSTLPSQHHQRRQYSNEENQYYARPTCPKQSMKRPFDAPSSSYHHNKRFHSDQTPVSVYPMLSFPSESFYLDPPPPPPPSSATSRYMLFKNDPSLSDTLPSDSVPSHGSLEHDHLYSDDIEHLLDIFKSEVEMIGMDPIATTSTGDYPLDMVHCLSANEFCSY